MTEIGENIRKYRNLAGLTQAQLAERVDIHHITVAKYETGKYTPGVDILQRIADALGVPMNALTGRTEKDIDPVSAAISLRYQNDPNYKALVDIAQTAKPEQLRAAVAVMRAMRDV